jgi:hypothetical protein
MTDCRWHHVLKSKFLQGKCNRRLDLLLSKLLTGVPPYYALKQRRQELSFEEPDIEVQKRQDICKRAKIYAKINITQVTAGKYLVGVELFTDKKQNEARDHKERDNGSASECR